jgi:hypothetical protein
MKIEIQELTEQKEWIDFKSIEGEEDRIDRIWNDAVKETAILNSKKEGKYRAVCVNGFITHIYCDGFYHVPTIRYW